jgi:hypothetical protein
VPLPLPDKHHNKQLLQVPLNPLAKQMPPRMEEAAAAAMLALPGLCQHQTAAAQLQVQTKLKILELLGKLQYKKIKKIFLAYLIIFINSHFILFVRF